MFKGAANSMPGDTVDGHRTRDAQNSALYLSQTPRRREIFSEATRERTALSTLEKSLG
jgi:hypothetical protein